MPESLDPQFAPVPESVATRWWPSTGLWRHADFLKLWFAQMASALGSRISRTCLPIIAILTIKATPTEVAILGALSVAPGVLVGLFAGGYIDRSRKRPLLVASDLARAALIVSVPAAAWFGALSMAQLYLVAALVGAATTLFQVTDNTFLPALVGRDALLEANSKLEATDSVAEAVGPGLAGVLVQILTAPIAMALDAISYVWSALLLSRIRAHEQPAAPPTAAKQQLWHDVATGFRTCRAHPIVGAQLAASVVAYFFSGFFLALYMIIALQVLNLSPAVIGLIISVGGIGAFLGALIARPLGRVFGTRAVLILCLGIGQLGYVGVALALHTRTFAIPLLVLQQLIGDAFLVAYSIHALSLRQREMPEAVLGRANATFHVVYGVALPAGALIAGPLTSVIGMDATVWVAAIGGLLAVPLLLGIRTPQATLV